MHYYDNISMILCCGAFSVCVLIVSLHCAAQGHPSHALQPVVIEYDPDPAWPDRPDGVAPFGWVSGLAIDGQGHIWVFNRGEDPVQVYTPEGAFVRTWGRGDFSDPHHIRIDHERNVWVSDFGRHVVQKYTPDGDLLLTLGVLDEKGDDVSHLNMPTDMAVAPDGDIFVTDGYGNRRIVHFDKDGKFINAWGTYGTGEAQFVLPHAIVLGPRGLLYVADRNSGRIMVFDQTGEQHDVWSNIIMPWGLSINQGNDLWVCGSSPHWWVRDNIAPEYKDQLLMRFDLDGRLRQVWSLPLGDIGPDKNAPDVSMLEHGETVGVHCIVQDTEGNLYVGDIYGQRAQKLIPVRTRPESESQAAGVPDH